jgi:hypothetical protein
VNDGVAFDARDVWASRERVGNLSRAVHQDGVNDVERLRLNLAFAQPIKDWPLCCLRFCQQGLINKTALLSLGWQIGRWTQIRLICENDKKLSLLSTGGVLDHPRCNLLCRGRMKPSLRTYLNALAYGVGRSDSSNERCRSCCEE